MSPKTGVAAGLYEDPAVVPVPGLPAGPGPVPATPPGLEPGREAVKPSVTVAMVSAGAVPVAAASKPCKALVSPAEPLGPVPVVAGASVASAVSVGSGASPNGSAALTLGLTNSGVTR